MMLSEFEKLTGLEVTTAEYEKIEAEYMESPDDKAKFCKMWLKKGGLQRLHNARLEEIEHLKDGEPIDVCSDDGQKRVETIFAQYGMGSDESMEMVLNAICTYTKWLNKTLLKGVPMA